MPSSNLIFWTLRNRNLKEIVGRVSDVVFGWMIRPLSFITPRSKKKWLIGNKTGWADNSKYLALALNGTNPENLRIIWIAKTKEQRDKVRSKGVEAYHKWSIKGLYHTLTAGALFYSSSSSDINYWASGKAFRMNMWHGVGLKKLGMKQSDVYNPSSITTRILTPFFYDKPDYFIGPSDMMAKHFADCYGLEDFRMLKIGYPRNDFMLQDKDSIREHIRKYESEKMADLVRKMEDFNKVYIYMPTFRDDQHDFIKASGLDFAKLNNLLKETNNLLLLKLHPATRVDSIDFKALENIVVVDKTLDVYPLLPFTDVLITDYSSIYYDYILMKDKDVILFPFDYDEYVSGSRDFAYDYLTYAPGVKAWNFNELYSIIKEDNDLTIPDRDAIIDTFWGSNYNNVVEKIKQATFDKIGV